LLQQPWITLLLLLDHIIAATLDHIAAVTLDTVAFHTIVVFVIPLVTFTNVNIHDVA
jgi:hypothetical protein